MRISILAVTILFAASALAQHHHGSHGGESPYAGQQSRDIKALSDQEVKDLLAGSGMGMAKAAELNRFPGPMHALELADRIGLSQDQRERLQLLMLQHKKRARQLGEEVVALERDLDTVFARGRPTRDDVDRLTASIGEAQGRLRADHLKTHLATTALLTPEQVARYVEARGYGAR